jgi:hypothetical protein
MGAIASIFTHRTLERKGLRAAAASMFKARVKLPAPGAEEGRSRWGARGGGGRSNLAAGGGAGGGKGKEKLSVWKEDEVVAVEKFDEGGELIPAHRPPPGGGGGGPGASGSQQGASGAERV